MGIKDSLNFSAIFCSLRLNRVQTINYHSNKLYTRRPPTINQEHTWKIGTPCITALENQNLLKPHHERRITLTYSPQPPK
ncbi:hypothetical protein Vi05172_g8057 [Venturia inaequalis]|nr:hypothetical protein Vi05172_g8057 [Venturia inaequalis]